MNGIVSLTRIVGTSEHYMRERSDGLQWAISPSLPLQTSECFLPVETMGPVTSFVVQCDPETVEWEGQKVEVKICEIWWGCLGTAGKIWVTEEAHVILARMAEAKRVGGR